MPGTCQVARAWDAIAIAVRRMIGGVRLRLILRCAAAGRLRSSKHQRTFAEIDKQCRTSIAGSSLCRRVLATFVEPFRGRLCSYLAPNGLADARFTRPDSWMFLTRRAVSSLEVGGVPWTFGSVVRSSPCVSSCCFGRVSSKRHVRLGTLQNTVGHRESVAPARLSVALKSMKRPL